MTTHSMAIDSRLVADSHALLDFQHGSIRLHNNATLPWVIIIPRTDVIEFCDLPTNQQIEITHLSRIIGDYFKRHRGAEKINFAAIGNVVTQLHIHVIGRHSNDPLWPNVVWGQELPEKPYSEQQLASIKADICACINNN